MTLNAPPDTAALATSPRGLETVTSCFESVVIPAPTSLPERTVARASIDPPGVPGFPQDDICAKTRQAPRLPGIR